MRADAKHPLIRRIICDLASLADTPDGDEGDRIMIATIARWDEWADEHDTAERQAAIESVETRDEPW